MIYEHLLVQRKYITISSHSDFERPSWVQDPSKIYVHLLHTPFPVSILRVCHFIHSEILSHLSSKLDHLRLTTPQLIVEVTTRITSCADDAMVNHILARTAQALYLERHDCLPHGHILLDLLVPRELDNVHVYLNSSEQHVSAAQLAQIDLFATAAATQILRNHYHRLDLLDPKLNLLLAARQSSLSEYMQKSGVRKPACTPSVELRCRCFVWVGNVGNSTLCPSRSRHSIPSLAQ